MGRRDPNYHPLMTSRLRALGVTFLTLTLSASALAYTPGTGTVWSDAFTDGDDAG